MRGSGLGPERIPFERGGENDDRKGNRERLRDRFSRRSLRHKAASGSFFCFLRFANWNALRWAQRNQGGFRSPPSDPSGLPVTPLETTRGAPLDPGLIVVFRQISRMNVRSGALLCLPPGGRGTIRRMVEGVPGRASICTCCTVFLCGLCPFALKDEVPTAQKTPPGAGAGRGKKLSKQKYYGILQFSEIFLHKKGRNA